MTDCQNSHLDGTCECISDHPLEEAIRAAEAIHPAWTDPNDPAAPRYVYAEIGNASDDPSYSQIRRAHIVNTALSLINGDRQGTYGDAAEDFTRTGRMWAAILGLPEVKPEQVALCMTAVKLGRLCHSPAHLDSWIDAVGYLALGGDIALSHDDQP